MILLMLQLVNAAKTAMATSQQGGNDCSAQKNLLMFRDAWQEIASLLTDAVDNTTSMHYFLAVSGELHEVLSILTVSVGI